MKPEKGFSSFVQFENDVNENMNENSTMIVCGPICF